MTNKIAEKIQKVLAKANSTTSATEAEIFMAKAQSMLEEHNMSMLDLDTLESDDPVGYDLNAVTALVNDSWYISLAHQVARYYGCDTFRTKLTKNKTGLTLVGRKSNRVTATLMLPYIKKQVIAVGKGLAQENPFKYRNERIAARHVANALGWRIHTLVHEQDSKEEARAAVGNALVPVDAIAAVMKDFGVVPARKVRRYTSAAAREAASKISLYRQTEGTIQKALAAK